MTLIPQWTNVHLMLSEKVLHLKIGTEFLVEKLFTYGEKSHYSNAQNLIET